MKCSRNDCEAPGTVSANHDGADYYCEQHGLCSRCGESVEFFVYCQDLHIWLCPCVAARRKETLPPRPEYNPETVAKVGKKAKNVREHWQRSA